MMIKALLLITCFLISWEILLGNLIVGMKCSDGIVLACDNYYINPSSSLVQISTAKSLYRINENIVVGFATRKQQGHKIVAELKRALLSSRLLYGRELSVEAVAHYARKMIYYRFPECTMIIAGRTSNCKENSQVGNPQQERCLNDKVPSDEYSLYQIAPGGSLFSQDIVSVGKSGPFFPVLLETLRPSNEKLPLAAPSFDPFAPRLEEKIKTITVDKAVQLIQNNIRAAIRNDHSAGGKSPVVIIISETGINYLKNQRKLK